MPANPPTPIAGISSDAVDAVTPYWRVMNTTPKTWSPAKKKSTTALATMMYTTVRTWRM